MESLGLTDMSALKQLVDSKGWSIDGDVVRISLNDDNTAKPKKVDVGGAASATRSFCSLQSQSQALPHVGLQCLPAMTLDFEMAI